MVKLDDKKLKDPEEFILVRTIGVRQHGETKAKAGYVGTKVTLSGMDKAELVARGIAVTSAEYARLNPSSAVAKDAGDADKVKGGKK